jgi:hypothetical protein
MRPSTVLVLGGEDDEHACAVIDRLRAAGHDAELLDSRWFPTQMTLWRNPQSSAGELTLPSGRVIAHEQILSVYWRTYNGVGVPPLDDDEQTFVAYNDARCLFESFLIDLPARWVNGWTAYQLHQTKPVQLARIAALGVMAPATLWTNDAKGVREFAAQHPQAIFKPVQGGDETRRLTAEHLTDENLSSLKLAPITIQAEVPGTNVRVFVAGKRVLACEVRTPQLDYRQDLQAELLVHQLPTVMEEQARQIAAALSLVWTGIDYRLTPKGEYVFLEANPSPMFLGFESQTGLPLTASLISLLTE